MALTTYAELKAAVADWLNRTDLTTQIVDFIALAEARIARTISSPNTSILQATLTAGDDALTLPAKLTALVSVCLSGSYIGSRVEIVSHAVLVEKRRLYPMGTVPRYCAVVGETLEFAPIVSADITVDIEVEGPFVPLSDAAPTNWILTDHPDLYLYGALAESAPYLKDDVRVAMWNGRFQVALKELRETREAWRFPTPTNVPVPRTFAERVPR